jgi:hypothetical protein
MDVKQLKLAADTIRVLSAEAIQKAKSGHPGMPMGCADAAVVLWHKYLRHNPKNPGWVGRDRFILSAGHGSMLLYSLLHLYGYGLSMEELSQFRQCGIRNLVILMVLKLPPVPLAAVLAERSAWRWLTNIWPRKPDWIKPICSTTVISRSAATAV